MSNIHWTILIRTLLVAFLIRKEPAIRETIESMEGNRRIVAERIKLIRIFALFNFVEIRCVGWMLHFWYVWCFLLPQVGIEIDAFEKCVRFYFIGVAAKTPFGRRT